MTTYIKTVSEPWFSLIKLKLKKVEGRLNKGDFSKMIKGDIIILTNSDFQNRTIKVKIKKIKYYDTFKEYLEKEKLDKCLPGIDTIDEGVNIYYKYYPKKMEEEFKIIAIRMKLII